MSNTVERSKSLKTMMLFVTSFIRLFVLMTVQMNANLKIA